MTPGQLLGAGALLAGVVLGQWSARVKPGPTAPLAGA